MLKRRVYVPGVFKTVIAPVQSWLLIQGRCVGCGRMLSEGKNGNGKKGLRTVICQCGRMFIHDKETKKHRRALLEEV